MRTKNGLFDKLFNNKHTAFKHLDIADKLQIYINDDCEIVIDKSQLSEKQLSEKNVTY